MMQLIRANLGYKILSVLLGAGLWLWVLHQQIQTDVRIRPVEVRNVPDGYVGTSCRPPEVQVTLRGGQQTIEALRREGVSVLADLARAQIEGPGEYSVPLVLSQVPTGVGKFWQISPPVATVVLEPIESKERTVLVEKVGMPDEKYQIASSSVEPQTVTVTGAKSAIHEVQQVVASVDVTGLDSDQSLSVPLQALGRGGLKVSGVEIRPPSVTVEVRVRPVEFRVVPVRVNLVGTLPGGHEIESVSVEPLVVTVRGDTSSSAFSSLQSVSTDVLDISGATGTVRRSVALRVPPEVSVISTRSCRVTVRIRAPAPPKPSPATPPPAGTPPPVEQPEAP
jgi:YbbR domain-containing protein